MLTRDDEILKQEREQARIIIHQEREISLENHVREVRLLRENNRDLEEKTHALKFKNKRLQEVALIRQVELDNLRTKILEYFRDGSEYAIRLIDSRGGWMKGVVDPRMEARERYSLPGSAKRPRESNQDEQDDQGGNQERQNNLLGAQGAGIQI